MGKEQDEEIVRQGKGVDKEYSTPQQCVDHALHHGFERASVLQDRRFLASSYRHALGKRGTDIQSIDKSFQQDDRFIRVQEKDRIMVTTKAVLSEEKEMIDLARKGIGKVQPFYKERPRINLEGKQAEAVEHILTTTSRISIMRGAAGTGKTTLMREAVRLIEDSGKKVIVVAPTAEASRGVLKEEGFGNAETVARLLVDPAMQEKLEGQVLWVDEAGLLGTKDMVALLRVAEKRDAHLILGGDTRQHASVIRGDALRILNTVGGIKSAEVTKIFRQKTFEYRGAVEDLSKGDVKAGFDKLDGLGFIKTVDPMKPNETLVDDYMEAVKKGKSTLVISPTHKQGKAVTEEIRGRLKKDNRIGKKELAVRHLVNRNLTTAQKEDVRNYGIGQVVQFNQNTKGFNRGGTWQVTALAEDAVSIQNSDKKLARLPVEDAQQFDVFEQETIALAKGDQIRITRNGFDQQDRRLNNGQTLTVKAVNKQGQIKLQNEKSKATYSLGQDFGHISHAYCVTSHASQGKTVDEVFISQPADTFAATDAKQFYVSVSRARDKAHIYTDDKTALLDNAAELGDRQSATELIQSTMTHSDYVRYKAHEDYVLQKSEHQPTQQKQDTSLRKERDYEPEL